MILVSFVPPAGTCAFSKLAFIENSPNSLTYVVLSYSKNCIKLYKA